MEKYSSYRPTGLNWVDQIPEEWKLVQFRQLFSIVKNIAGTSGIDVLSVTQNGLKVKDIESKQGQMASDYSKYQIVEKGDFAMNHMDLLTGGIGISIQYGVTSPDYRVFKAKSQDVLKEYFLYIFQQCYSRKIFYGLGHGVSNKGRWRLPADMLNKFMLPVPPLSEQIAIVDYLDREMQKIDSFIAAEEKELALLDELKQAEIANAVTHGLNPDAPMKPSGISWLGDIPAHWEFARFGYIMKEMFMGRTPEYSMEPNDMLIIGQKNNQKGAFCPDGIKYATENFYSSRPENEFLRNKDIILNTLGGGSVGRVGYFIDTENRRILTDGHLMIIRTDEKILISKFLFYFLDSKRKELERDASGSTNQVFLTVKGVSKYYSPIPPFEEQQKIVKYLDEKCANIAHLVSNIQSEIDHLKEYKQRLIADAVTGQIKVC